MSSSDSEDDCVVYWHSEPLYKQATPPIPVKLSQTPRKKRDTLAAALPSPSALDPVTQAKPQRRIKRSRSLKASTSNVKIDDAALKVMDELAKRLSRHANNAAQNSPPVLPSTLVKPPRSVSKPFVQKHAKLPSPKPNTTHLPSPESLPRLQPLFPPPRSRPVLAAKPVLSEKAKEKQREIEKDEFDEYFGGDDEGFELAACSQLEIIETRLASQSRAKGTTISPPVKSTVVVPAKPKATTTTGVTSKMTPPPLPPKPKSTIVPAARANPFAKNVGPGKSKVVSTTVQVAAGGAKAMEKRKVQKTASQEEIDALIDGVDLDNWSDDDF